MNNFIWVFFISVFFNLFAIRKENRTVEIISKMLLMPSLFFSFRDNLSLSLLFVCIFYTIGDGFMLSSSFCPMLFGALAFFIGHVFYYYTLFFLLDLNYLPFALLLTVLFVAYNIKYILNKREIDNYLELGYISFVSILMCFALSTGSLLMSIGAFLFAFSDMLIIKEKNEIIKAEPLWVMFTYVAANFLLLYGYSQIIR